MTKAGDRRAQMSPRLRLWGIISAGKTSRGSRPTNSWSSPVAARMRCWVCPESLAIPKSSRLSKGIFRVSLIVLNSSSKVISISSAISSSSFWRRIRLRTAMATAFFAACCPMTYLSSALTISFGDISSRPRVLGPERLEFFFIRYIIESIKIQSLITNFQCSLSYFLKNLPTRKITNISCIMMCY